MDLTPKLYLMVIQYINGELSRSALEDWLVPHLEELLSPGSPGSHELVGELELDLAELNHGDVTEEELRTSLGKFLQSRVTIIRNIEEPLRTTVQSAAITEQFSTTPMIFSPWQAPTEPLSASETVQQEAAFAGR